MLVYTRLLAYIRRESVECLQPQYSANTVLQSGEPQYSANVDLITASNHHPDDAHLTLALTPSVDIISWRKSQPCSALGLGTVQILIYALIQYPNPILKPFLKSAWKMLIM